MKKRKKMMDGNTAAAYISYAFSEVACIYPITPSSTMAELVDEWSAKNVKNIFNSKLKVVEMQSEAGAAGALHGALQAGALSTTFTASQGLLLMIPNMYKIAGELLPCVFQVASRTVATHALSIFGDHSDVMAVRQTGFAIICSNSVQEVMDLSAISYLSSYESRVPFLHFFDGFRTSHEIQKIEVLDYEDLRKLVDEKSIINFRKKALNPEKPVVRGTSQNPDIYFQQVESRNIFYNNSYKIIEKYMDKIYKLTGRMYNLYDYYGDEKAKMIIVAMGSVCDTIEEVVDYINVRDVEKVGVLKVRLFRPFVKEKFIEQIPNSVVKIAVLDKTKENGSIGEPLYLDVLGCFYDKDKKPIIVGGRYGLSSKDTTPSDINAVFTMLKENPRHNFTIGIIDDVTNLSLDVKEKIIFDKKDIISCKFFGMGSDGTVGANKQAIKIIGDFTDKYAQGYFSYDSKKSGGLTISHLRFGDSKIKAPYLINNADYIACHSQPYVYTYDLLEGLKKGGIFVLNTVWNEEEVKKFLPYNMKKYIFDNDIRFYIINANKIASNIGLGRRINMIMQSVFFNLSKVMDIDEACEYLKKSIIKNYSKKGEEIVNMNIRAIDEAIENLIEINVDDSFLNVYENYYEVDEKLPNFIKKFLFPMERQKGNELKVSDFLGREDGTFETATSQYEKRGIAINIPYWEKDNCIQCAQCSIVCPHGAIRPFLVSKTDEMDKKPVTFETIKALGRNLENYEYRIQVSPLDCTGCGVCVQVCPGKRNQKALEMKSIESQVKNQRENWNFAMSLSEKGNLFDKFTLKGSQFQKPLFEFSGACAGCGETAYIKLITQLFGEKMVIANATGCTSIYSASGTSMPYCVTKENKGPAWANSLFEDNAEYGYGMKIAQDSIRNHIKELMIKLLQYDIPKKEAFESWIENIYDNEKNKEAIFDILEVFQIRLEDENAQKILNKIEELKDFLMIKSQWIIGGDGWAYDIGYGGLDHVVASGENVNILILDTEVYSNTGGQSSKATPIGAIAKFASDGMRSRKKDLGLMLSSYQNAYIAQVSLGANMNQCIKAIKEAEEFNGPSIIIAYSPCIEHGIKTGMDMSSNQEKLAVETGYWHLFRYDPRNIEKGKNPFMLDSREPKKKIREFLETETRYTALKRISNEIADKIFEVAQKQADEKYKHYYRLSKLDYSLEEPQDIGEKN